MKATFISAALLFAFSGAAFAGECVLTINRSACPGKETKAYKPYNGKNPTIEPNSTADMDACKRLAAKTVKIIRAGTLSKKVLTATFDGADAGSYSDEKACK